MNSIHEKISRIIDEQKFYDAAESLENIVKAYKKTVPGHEETGSDIIKNLIDEKERIRNTHVINPMQYDELYASVKNTLNSFLDKITQLPGFNDFYNSQDQTQNSLKRYIVGERLAICDHIRTKENLRIAFAFNFEDFYPEYDRSVVDRYPDFFYLEDSEVLAVKDEIDLQLSLNEFIEIAKDHPTGAINIYDSETGTGYLTNKPVPFLNESTEDWYWKKI
jgi:hypothetical protein